MDGRYFDAYDTGRMSVQRCEIFEHHHDYWQSSKVNQRQDVFLKNSSQQMTMFHRKRQHKLIFVLIFDATFSNSILRLLQLLHWPSIYHCTSCATQNVSLHQNVLISNRFNFPKRVGSHQNTSYVNKLTISWRKSHAHLIGVRLETQHSLWHFLFASLDDHY